MNCEWCGEPVERDERHPAFHQSMHRECGVRAVCGSVAHIEHRCSCYVPGSAEGDDPSLTKRDGARLAAAAFLKREGLEC